MIALPDVALTPSVGEFRPSRSDPTGAGAAFQPSASPVKAATHLSESQGRLEAVPHGVP